MPESDESENDRFKRFAKAILAVPKAEIPTAEEAIGRPKAQSRTSTTNWNRSNENWRSASRPNPSKVDRFGFDGTIEEDRRVALLQSHRSIHFPSGVDKSLKHPV